MLKPFAAAVAWQKEVLKPCAQLLAFAVSVPLAVRQYGIARDAVSTKQPA